MTIYPSTDLTLYGNIPFDYNYNHTMYFKYFTDQSNYFKDWLPREHFENYQYLRHTGQIKITAPEDSNPYRYNYLSYLNPDNLRVFGFITDISYININTWLISYRIDYYQTFFLYCKFNPCLVDREHVASDNKGEHTEPEPFDAFGQLIYKCVASPVSDVKDVPSYDVFTAESESGFVAINDFFGDRSWMACISVTQDITKLDGYNASTMAPDETVTQGKNHGGIYNGGIYYYGWRMRLQSSQNALANLIALMSSLGQLDSITNIFMATEGSFLVGLNQGGSGSAGLYEHGVDCRLKVDCNQLGVYTPKNNKMYTYPFNYLYVSNSEGNSAIYKFEYFDKYEQDFGSTFFSFTGQLAPGYVMGVFPRNYTGILYNVDAMLTTAPYPLCPWSSDVYQAYVALNSGKIAAQKETLDLNLRHANIRSDIATVMDMAGAIGNVATGNLGGAVRDLAAGGLEMYNKELQKEQYDQQAKNIAAEMYDISVIPPQAHGNQSTDTIMSTGTKGFTFYQVYPNSESCKIIDDFFTMFGYKRGIIKVPELTSRRAWNYVKTSGCHLTGDCPMSVINILNKIFDSGITLWHQKDTYGDYTQANTIRTG